MLSALFGVRGPPYVVYIAGRIPDTTVQRATMTCVDECARRGDLTPRLSRDYAHVATGSGANHLMNVTVTPKCSENEEGGLINGPRLLISGFRGL